MHVLFIVRVAVAVPFLTIVAAAQTPSSPQKTECGTTLSTFLTMVAGQDDPPDQRERFEFHECPGSGVQLWAFERGHATPTLVSDVFDFPMTLFQSLNVIAFQSSGGSSDQVYIYAFQKGQATTHCAVSNKGPNGGTADRNEAVDPDPCDGLSNSHGFGANTSVLCADRGAFSESPKRAVIQQLENGVTAENSRCLRHRPRDSRTMSAKLPIHGPCLD
jgi:hypothetical protein